ncbi:C40 family peptidase [Ottowia sp.]|uniref:C40 family peptidase n=1 Tax=Ottowia sp. TaxID=1898956 RepID=UPI003A84D265
MHSKIAAFVLVAATGLSNALAAPDQAKPPQQPSEKSSATRMGESIGQASTRATELVMNAFGALDIPYRFGGTSRATGFDCSGFVRAMFEQTAGLLLPRRAAEQAAATTKINKAELKPGDLVFFNTLRRSFSHVGIYIGDGKFMHAPRKGAQVRVESMNVRYWQKRFDGARRVFASEPATSADSAAPASAAAIPSSPSTETAPRVLNRESPAPSAVRLGGTASRSSNSTPTPPAADQSI